MPAIRHAEPPAVRRVTGPMRRPVGVRPAMRPGSTDKASAVAHYEAMAQQVARERSAGQGGWATDVRPDAGV